MRSWADGRLVAFDIETTGVDVEEARIVTAAIVAVGGGQPTERLTWLLDPGVEIPAGAAEVHGITTEHARAHGVPAERAIPEIALALGDRLAPDVPLVAFNMRFDATIADREIRRHGGPGMPDGFYGIDPLVLDKHLHRFRKGSRRLDAQCAHYGAVLDDAHEASADALAAARVAWCIGKRGEVVRRVRNANDGRELARLKRQWEEVRHDLPALHAAQVTWAARQAESLEEYFRKQGTLEAPLERAWPMVPVRQPVPA